MNDSDLTEALKNRIEWIVFLPVRLQHRRRARAKTRARVAALGAVRHTLESATDLNAGGATTVFNVGLYLLMLDEDIAYFTDDLVCAVGDRRRAFLAKHEALLLYEAAQDLPQLLGRRFRDAVTELGASSEQLARLNSTSSELNQFWSSNWEFLGAIRNALAAHRDHNALLYARSLEALKPLEVMARAVELSLLLDRLVGVISELASLTFGAAAILSDMKRTADRAKAG
jgi:hypothetical protein